eukprot:g9862.t1
MLVVREKGNEEATGMAKGASPEKKRRRTEGASTVEADAEPQDKKRSVDYVVARDGLKERPADVRGAADDMFAHGSQLFEAAHDKRRGISFPTPTPGDSLRLARPLGPSRAAGGLRVPKCVKCCKEEQRRKVATTWQHEGAHYYARAPSGSGPGWKSRLSKKASPVLR